MCWWVEDRSGIGGCSSGGGGGVVGGRLQLMVAKNNQVSEMLGVNLKKKSMVFLRVVIIIINKISIILV